MAGVRFEADRCSACNACGVACIDQNDLETGTGKVLAYRFVTEEETRQADGSYRFSQRMHGCMHCAEAPCIQACGQGCLKRDEETGLVLPDNTNCTGCGMCATACPFDAIRFGRDGKMRKCDGCIERLRQGLRPACEKICPPQVLSIQTKQNERANMM